MSEKVGMSLTHMCHWEIPSLTRMEFDTEPRKLCGEIASLKWNLFFAKERSRQKENKEEGGRVSNRVPSRQEKGRA